MEIQEIGTKEVLNKCSHLSVRVYNSNPWNDAWTEEKAYERLSCYYNTPNFIGLVALEKEVILGCLLGNIEPYFSGDYFYLKEMFVATNSQRNGIGSKLIKHLKDHLITYNVNSILLFTSKDLFPYVFYKKIGFKPIDNMCMMDCKYE